jgi:very-short-patch-repair endonuclease
MKNIKNGKYLKFEEAIKIIQEKKFKSRNEFLSYLKSNNIKNIPSNPYYVYKENWLSLDNWLGRDSKSNKNSKFKSYKDSEKIVHFLIKGLKIDTKSKWLFFYEENLNKLKEVPKHPQICYKNKGWISWSKWLNNKSSSDKYDYTLDEVKKIVIKNKIQTRKEYYSLCKLEKIPTDPISKYNLKSWNDILCKKDRKRRKEYINYTNAKEIVHKMNLKSQKEWYKLCKENKIQKDIPKTPNSYYDNDWISWNDWLGHNITTNKKFISYKKAKEHLFNIGLTSLQEYNDYLIDNNIDFLPLQPQSYYGTEYKSVSDFLNLGISKFSYGEKKIIKFLDKNKIGYIHQHRFDDCCFINKLIFDFYLIDKRICIEFDGEQHFRPIDFFGGEEAFLLRKKRDSIKDKYCIENKIKMIRISYEDINIVNKILTKYLLS